MKTTKLNLLFLIFIFFYCNEMSFAQGTFEWSKNYSHPGLRSQIAYDIAADTNGNVYITGLNSNGYSVNDMVTIKYNAAGVYQWGKTYNLSPDYTGEAGKSIAVYRNGNKTYVYAAGEVAYSGATQFIKIIKYDQDGNEIWQKEYDPGVPGENDNLTKVMADASGNCYIAGNSLTKAFLVKYDSSGNNIYNVVHTMPAGYSYVNLNDCDLDAAGNIYITGSCDTSNTKHFMTFKYSSAGIFKWFKLFKGEPTYQNAGRNIKVGKSGRVYVTGEFINNSVDYDFLTIKYDSANGDTVWTRKYNALPSSWDYGKVMTIDANENIIVSGISYFGSYTNIHTVKYDSLGVQKWIKTYNGPGGYSDEVRDVACDNSGNIFLTGISDNSYFGSYLTIKYASNGDALWTKTEDVAPGEFDAAAGMVLDINGNTIVTGNSGNSGTDIGTIKYNSSGGKQWTVKFYGAQITFDRANDIAADKKGNVYVIGRARTTQFGDNIQIIKYNSAGERKWVYNRGGTFAGYDAYDEGNSIAVDTSGNVYFTGTIYSHPSSKQEIATGKLDSNGNNIWLSFKSGIYGNDAGLDIMLDASGNVYVSGEFNGIAENMDFILLKYNNSGTEIWSRGYGSFSNSYDSPVAMTMDKAGNIYLTGCTSTSGLEKDIVTIKYNSSGTEQWSRVLTGTANGDDEVRSIDVDKYGNVYIAGSLFNSGTGSDMFIVKYSSGGSQNWITTKTHSNTLKETSAIVRYDSITSLVKVVGDLESFLYPELSQLTWVVDTSGVEAGASYLNSASTPTLCYGGTLNAAGRIYSVHQIEWGSTGKDIASRFSIPIDMHFNGASNGDDFPARNNPIAVFRNNVYIAASSYDSIKGFEMTVLKYNVPVYALFARMFIQGFYRISSDIMIPDTVTFKLRNKNSPYNLMDSAKTLCGPFGDAEVYFQKIADGGPYYLTINHRNSIETWSDSAISFDKGIIEFSMADTSNVYGRNLIQVVPSNFGKYCIYNGDVNQDGTVDLTDNQLIDNDAYNYAAGYLVTDLTGDNSVDLSDAAIADNNAFNYVSKIRP